MPEAPLDVLAQQIVAAVAAESVGVDTLWQRFRNAAPYRSLSREDFVAVVRALAEPLPAEVKGAAPRILWDRVNDRLHARRGSRFLALTSGGTIPDAGLFDVFVAETDLKVGTLDEEFVTESLPGDVFLLGSHAWRIVKVRADRVLVEDADGMSPTIPFWKGEHPSRSWELGVGVARLRRDAAAALAIPGFDEWAAETCGLDGRAAAAMHAWLTKAGEVLGGVPDEDEIVVESFADEMGGRHAMIHSPFGMRVNGAWGMALRVAVRRRFGLVAEASHVDDGILLSFAPGQVPPAPERLVKLVAPADVDTLLGHALIGSPLFTTRFRHCAIRALFIARMWNGTRTPPYLQRLKADALMESVGGLAEFPVVAETLRECFHDALDVPRLKRLLERLHDGELRARHVDTPVPSPFVYPLLLAWDWAYLDAGHAEERRSDAVSMRKAWSVSPGPLRPEIVAGVEAELQKTAPDRRARDANELAAILDDLGDLTREEIAARSAADADMLIDALRAERRITEAEFAGGRRAWIPTADAMHYAALATDAGLARIWEQDLVVPRVEDYQREWLDRLGLAGEIVWTVFEPRETAAARPGRVGLALRENAGWLRPAPTPRAELDPRVKNVLLHLQLRGASFAQDLAKVAGLDTAATLSALWELFWAGLVTPDTFSAIAAGVAAPRAAAPGASRRRPRRGARRAPLARLPVIGRWSALAEEEGLSPEEREEARAHLLLARYGVLSRELAQGDWSTLRHTLLRMEYGGEVVRGYFVEGLSGEQYALEDTLRELETPARRAEPHVLVTIADPANLWGRVFTLTRRDGQRAAAARIPTTWLITRAGRPVLLVDGQGRSLTPLAGWEAVDLPGAIRALQAVVEPPLPLRRVRRLDVEEWEDRPIRESEAFDAFVAAGFSVDGPRLSWDGHPGPRWR